MTEFQESVMRGLMADGMDRDLAELVAGQVGKQNQAQARIDEVRKQASMLRLCGAPTLLAPFVAAGLSLDEVKAAVHAKLRRGFLNTRAIEDLRADAAAGRLRRPEPVATVGPVPTLAEIGAQVYARRAAP